MSKHMPLDDFHAVRILLDVEAKWLERAASVKCTFSGVVPIDLKRFEESGVAHVECPDCGRVWTLSPSGGVLRFKSHDKRKTNANGSSVWWAMRETIWEVIGR